MRLMVIPLAIGTLGTVVKGFDRGLEVFDTGGRMKTILTTALLRSAKILNLSFGDLMRLTVTQTLVKYHQLMLV